MSADGAKEPTPGVPPDEGELQAYVDGLLDRRRQAEIERYLLLDPREARRIRAYQAQRASLSLLLHEMPIPPERREISELGFGLAGSFRRQRRFQRGVRSIAVVMLLLAAVPTGWLARGYLAPPPARLPSITQQAANGYRLFAENGGFATPSQATEAQDPFRWLTKRAVGRALASPDLQSVGFTLLNGWIFPTARGDAVQLLYQDGSGQVITLYVVYGEALPPSTFSHLEEGDLSLLFWRSGSVSYCLVGRLDQSQLVAIAELVTTELSSPVREAPIKTDAAQTAKRDGASKGVPEGGQTVPAKAEPLPVPAGPSVEPSGASSTGGAKGAPEGGLPDVPTPAAKTPSGAQSQSRSVPKRSGQRGETLVAPSDRA